MNFDILYTDNFEKELKRLAKKYRSIKSDLANFLSVLEKNPTLGIPLSKNCYKIRVAISSKGKGKSGGARIITHVHVDENLIYLLSIYNKSDKESISNKELEALLKYIQ